MALQDRLGKGNQILEAAKKFAERGWMPMPADAGNKHPGGVAWTKYTKGDRVYDFDTMSTRFKANSVIWLPTGTATGLVVLDCDNEEAVRLWTERLGPVLRQTRQARGSKGAHYYFTIPTGDSEFVGWTHKNDREAEQIGAQYDIQGDGRGVVAPPSMHSNGIDRYRWLNTNDPVPLPADIDRWRAQETTDQGKSVKSMVATLLERGSTEGGRNDWMASVAGHVAKMTAIPEIYTSVLKAINDGRCHPPLDDEELAKIADSIWEREAAKTSADYTADSGWLIGDGTQIWTRCKSGDSIYPDRWANFDLRCEGVIDTEGEGRSYVVRFLGERFDDLDQQVIEPGMLGEDRRVKAWLSRWRGVVQPPRNELNPGGLGSKLQLYLEDQGAPEYTAVTHLGWHPGYGFVTHDGVIDADQGLVPFDRLRPSRQIRNWAPYHYGFEGTQEEAFDVLRQVLTFHDDTVTAVFGAWWAACMLKVHLENKVALFPIMALEAPSESGKTTGFFALMQQLAGNNGGHGESTNAALRDALSVHANAPVWIDDVTDTSNIADLLRQATSGGSRTKKGVDRTTQETVKFRTPIVISGEGISGLDSEKAMMDRSVRLSVPAPTGRRSLIDPSKPQWDDIVRMQDKYGRDLSRFAGWIVQEALRHTHLADEVLGLRLGNGRHADKTAILRVGARLLEALTGDHSFVQRVDEWAAGQEDTGAENILTREILPRLISDDPRYSPRGGPAVYMDGNGQVWMSDQGVARMWREQKNLTPRERQLGEMASIASQRQALGRGNKTVAQWIDRDRTMRRRYHQLDPVVSASVIDRSEVNSERTSAGTGTGGGTVSRGVVQQTQYIDESLGF